MKPIETKEQVTCIYCDTVFSGTWRFCPLCRKMVPDLSGKHQVSVQPPKQVPITYDRPEKVIVTINRGKDGHETIKGKVVDETSTHYKVQSLAPYNVNEWFAKQSIKVNCQAISVHD